MKISLSELDENRFGVVTAKISFEGNESLNEVISWCAGKKAELMIGRIPTEQIRFAQEMEQAGFFLTDTLVYFRNEKILAEEAVSSVELPRNYSWRIAIPEDAEAVGKLAEKIFSGYGGHYHADRHLKRSDCDLVYSSWAANSCLNNRFSDSVFLVALEHKTVGFITLKSNDSGEGEIILNGVHPDFQGKGLYYSLISLAKKWAAQQQLKHLIVSTQVTNLAVQKVWCRQGFEPYKSYYTFHKWLNPRFLS